MQHGHLGPFELMYNIQFGKMVIAFSCLLFNNEVCTPDELLCIYFCSFFHF